MSFTLLDMRPAGIFETSSGGGGVSDFGSGFLRAFLPLPGLTDSAGGSSGSRGIEVSSGESEGVGLCSMRVGRAQRGTTRSGRSIGARCVPGRIPRDMDASCSLIV